MPLDAPASDAYRTLERRFERLSLLDDAIGILDWDTQTVMPDGAAASRSDQLAELRVIRHEILTAPDIGDLLDLADADRHVDVDPETAAWRSANLREMRRLWLHATAVPADLVAANSKATSACEMVWRTARPANDFAALAPHLGEVLTMQRRIAAAKAERLGLSAYDALLDLYEPGGRAAEIDTLFAELSAALPSLIDAVIERQAGQPAPLRPQGPFPVDAQRALGARLMAAVGFDFRLGRLDVSLHPFCGGATDDVRITTRYDEADFTSALMGVLHETGHALYELNRPQRWRRQPVGAARGMAMHESQSLLVEMQASRSPMFLAWLADEAARAFDGAGPAWTAGNLIRLYRQVGRSFIRVDADEVTYPAHVILRYRLERAVIAGDLSIQDLPGAWADGMRELLGVIPPDDRRGCLQDIHWPVGAFGYFPCYTLGAMIAAQLFEAATTREPDVAPSLTHGDFAPLMHWLKREVHSRASTATTADIVTAATGRPLDAGVFLAHLRRRYLD